MKNPSEIIKKINVEYADLINSEITGRKLLDNIKSYEDLKKRAQDKSGLLLPDSYGYDSSFKKNVHSLQTVLREFWKDKNDDYMQSLSELESLKIYTIGGLVENLALYFDTVIFSHATPSRLHPSGDPIKSTITILESIIPVYNFIPLLKADTNFPIIAFNPNYDSSSRFEKKLYEGNFGQQLEIGSINAKKIGIDALNKFSKIDLNIKSPLDIQNHIRRDGFVILDELFHVEELMKFIDERRYILNKVIDDKIAKEMLDAVNMRKNMISGDAFMRLMILFFVEFETLVELDEQTTRLKAYPHIHQAELYKLKMEIESGYLREYLDFDDRMFAANSLNLPHLVTLGDLSFEEIVRFRESGGMEEIRSAFRNKCNQIKHVAIEDYESVRQKVYDELKQRVDDNNNNIRASEIDIRNTIKKNTVDLGLSLMIDFLLINIPPVASSTYLAPAALANFLKTLAEGGVRIYNDFVTRQRAVKELKNRPIGIIAKNLER